MTTMAKKRDLLSDNRKYGFPVSGRVPEGAANKIRKEALKSGISMSKMISLIVSKWASSQDEMVKVSDYEKEVERLKKELSKKKKSISKWEKYYTSECDRINRVWNESVVEMLNEIAGNRAEQKRFASMFNAIFKKNNQ